MISGEIIAPWKATEYLISATIQNSGEVNDIKVSTEGSSKSIQIPARVGTKGSSVNGGELLFLALATCFCNDIYREAAKREMTIDGVDVTVNGDFGGEGEPASNISYVTEVKSSVHSKDEINDLIQYVDKIAEIHNTLRQGIHVTIRR
jgi:organic hydroperoxide reductase OsmC/OhrA